MIVSFDLLRAALIILMFGELTFAIFMIVIEDKPSLLVFPNMKPAYKTISVVAALLFIATAYLYQYLYWV
jgi:hypothetical protein